MSSSNSRSIFEPRVPPELQGSVQLTTVDRVFNALYNWGRKRSIYLMQFGLACCAFEMIGSAAPRFDYERCGIIRQLGGAIVGWTLVWSWRPANGK
jgi:NADH:ubiquinone oxidoreductase subunit B-like Fe-S oxidoreductase